MDVEDIASLPEQVSSILTKYPKIDTVRSSQWLLTVCCRRLKLMYEKQVLATAGMQTSFSIKDDSPHVLKTIQSEITINMIGSITLAHLFTPHLLALGRPTSFILVSSGLAYIPLPLYASYNATKAGIHAFALGMRGQLRGTNVHVIELAPPYVESELDTVHKEKNIAIQGGPEKATKPMPLEEYLDKALAELEKENVKEAAVGFAQLGATTWRKAFDPVLENLGFDI